MTSPAGWFIDTCALKWRYVSGPPTSALDAIVDSVDTAFISEFSLIEWSSAFGCLVRDGTITYDEFKSNELALMTDIADAKLEVVPTTRDFERVRALIEYAGVRHLRALRTGDAIQLVTALEVDALAPLNFVTCDKKLADIAVSIKPMRDRLRSHFLAQ